MSHWFPFATVPGGCAAFRIVPGGTPSPTPGPGRLHDARSGKQPEIGVVVVVVVVVVVLELVVVDDVVVGGGVGKIAVQASVCVPGCTENVAWVALGPAVLTLTPSRDSW